MKAGSAGSIPDGVSTDSQPLAILLRDIGQTVFVLNTTVVGLDAVEKGHPKPDTLDISWAPQDRMIAARQSRKFVLEAVLTRASEAVVQYAVALSKLPRVAAVRKNWDSKTTKATKVHDVFVRSVDDNYLAPAAALIVHWRNRIIHGGSNAELTPAQKVVLRDGSQEILGRYKNLSVDLLLEHFDTGRPSLKDVSTLVAMSINAARQSDAGIQDNLSREELDAWVEHYGLAPKLARVLSESGKAKREDSVRRLLGREACLLTDVYLKHYPVN